jgi:hypothetical protein
MMTKQKNMKRNKLRSIWCIGVLSVLTMSCENADVEFPDYDKTTVYFAYQYPVRTIVLGEDIYNTTLDNEHKCEIYDINVKFMLPWEGCMITIKR